MAVGLRVTPITQPLKNDNWPNRLIPVNSDQAEQRLPMALPGWVVVLS